MAKPAIYGIAAMQTNDVRLLNSQKPLQHHDAVVCPVLLLGKGAGIYQWQSTANNKKCIDLSGGSTTNGNLLEI
jgi:hypothetical protein